MRIFHLRNLLYFIISYFACFQLDILKDLIKKIDLINLKNQVLPLVRIILIFIFLIFYSLLIIYK